jgi:hypothetical protein
MAQSDKNGGALGFSTSGKFQTDLRRLSGFIGSVASRLGRVEPHVAYKAANIIAVIYRGRLRQGVGPSLSPMTRALTGQRKPLSTLANHVKVKKSSGGVAYVTFGADPKSQDPNVKTSDAGWTRIALLLDRGFAMKMTARMYHAMAASAMDNLGINNMQEIFGQGGLGASGGIVLVPARPHLHWLTKNDNVLRAVAHYVAFGIPLSPKLRAMMSSPRVDKVFDSESIREGFEFGFRFSTGLGVEYSGASGGQLFDEVP